MFTTIPEPASGDSDVTGSFAAVPLVLGLFLVLLSRTGPCDSFFTNEAVSDFLTTEGDLLDFVEPTMGMSYNNYDNNAYMYMYM